jgi:ubiquinone/menaquinone biosynthesis C-methylase UbiE
MGRFATTVPLYQEFRPPYPGEFFRAVSERLGFTHQHQLIDLGTGPGLLALGFAPYVGRIVGVDPEPAMVTAARENAARQGKRFTLIEGKAETLPPEMGRFDVVTIGRALHWMERDAVAALFDRLVTPDGVIVVCASRSANDGLHIKVCGQISNAIALFIDADKCRAGASKWIFSGTSSTSSGPRHSCAWE